MSPQSVDPRAAVRAAVLGSPIAHSLSPVLHRAAYAALGTPDRSYDAFEVDEAGLPAFVDALGPEWSGLSLTMPLKRVALDVADEVDERAAAIGAANTLVLSDGRRTAFNTDVTGLRVALSRAGAGSVRGAQGDVEQIAGSGAADRPATESARAVVLGAGGTAQAAIAALDELGIGDVTVLVRDARRAGDLQAAAERLGVAPEVSPVLTDDLAAARALSGADVVISTLPAGAADALAGAHWRPGVTLLDAVYAPWPTAIAAGAAAGGARIVSGLEMLLQQAVEQVRLMTGRPGPEAAMRAALDDAVLARAGA